MRTISKVPHPYLRCDIQLDAIVRTVQAALRVGGSGTTATSTLSDAQLHGIVGGAADARGRDLNDL